MKVSRDQLITITIFLAVILLLVFSLQSILLPSAVPGETTLTPGNPTSEGDLVIKPGDNGTTIHMVVGQRFLLDLGSDYQWEIKIDNPNVLQRIVNIMVIKGAQGVYQAKQVGTTTLSATGTLACLPGEICSQQALAFQIQVVVTV